MTMTVMKSLSDVILVTHPEDTVKKVAGTIDEEVKRIIDECYLKAKAILEEHQSVLEACASYCWKKKRLQEVSLKHFLRSRCRMGKLFLMPGRHFKGLAPKEVYMNKNALFCDGTSDYVIPAEPGIHEKVRLRFRTARDDAQEVCLISGGEALQMQKISSGEVFDYYGNRSAAYRYDVCLLFSDKKRE